MRKEINEIEKQFKDYQSIYLYGPVGMGKTHIVYSLPQILSQHESACLSFFFYISKHEFLWESREWIDRSKVKIQACYIHPKSSNKYYPWQGLKETWTDLDLPEQEIEKLKHDTPEIWMKIIEALSSRGYKRVVVIVDDYDRWMIGEKNLACQEMRKCLAWKDGNEEQVTEAVFWLTGEKRVEQLQSNNQIVFVSDIELVKSEIPSSDTVREIMSHTLSSSPSPEWLSKLITDDQKLKEVETLTGGYPILVQYLTEEIARISQDKKEIDECLFEVEKSKKCHDLAQYFYDSLDNKQKHALGLLSIAEKKDLKNILNKWQTRSPDKALKEDDLQKVFKDLHENYLLVRLDIDGYKIGSFFLKHVVQNEEVTSNIRIQAGVHDYNFKIPSHLIFSGLFLFGITCYIFTFAMQNFIDINRDLYDFINFLYFAPCLVYLSIWFFNIIKKYLKELYQFLRYKLSISTNKYNN